MYKIIIDNRETKLIALFEENNIDIDKQNLDIGDIHFLYNNQPIIIIERKTLSDLCASIKDGRYKEQKIRLISNYNNIKKIYLIENSGCFNLGVNTLISCKINMILRDNIHIIESSDINNSFTLLINIRKNIEKYTDNLICKEGGDLNENIKYSDYISVSKKNNMNKETIEIMQLTMIPGVSKSIASLILQKYSNIRNFYIKLNNEDKDIIINEIGELMNGKRKIGRKIASKIIESIL